MGNECEGEAELELEFLLSDRSTWGTKLQHSTVPKYRGMYSSRPYKLLYLTVRYIPVVADDKTVRHIHGRVDACGRKLE